VKAGLIFFIIWATSSAFGQVKISGKLTDAKGNPLPNASVLIKNTYDGSTTDSIGNYEIVTAEKGEQTVEVSLSGFNTYEKSIMLDKGDLVLNFSLKEHVTELKAVILSAGAFEASDQKRVTVLNSIDIVTTASANADITAAIKTLPGAQQVGEEEGLFVRGGTAGESKTFIDGTLVNNFYFSSEPGLAQRGRFNPFLFKGTVFSAGGYSALYGQALSSVLILESIDFPEQSSAQLSVSYLSVGGGVQQLSKSKKFSWGAIYNYTDLRLAFKLVKQRPDYFKLPVIHNGDVNVRLKTKGGIVKYYAMFGKTDVGFRYADLDSTGMKNAFTLNNLNIYHNLSWKENYGHGFKTSLGLSFSNNKDELNNDLVDTENNKQVIDNDPLLANKNFGLVSKGSYINSKFVLEKKLNGLSAWRAGGEFNHSRDRSDFNFYDGTGAKEQVVENLAAAFAETDIYVTNNMAVKAGTRAEHSSLLDRWSLAPRLSLAYKLGGNSQVSFAYGIFYQAPERKYLPALSETGFAKATHYILQYQKLTGKRTFRTEVFYKGYDNLYKTTSFYGRQQVFNNNGSGYAKGIEVFWRDKKTIRHVDYWISYSYLDTKRDYLQYPYALSPSFAATHTASLVLKKFVTSLKSMFNASYTYASGRPYYNFMRDSSGKIDIADKGKTRSFNNLSFSVNFLPNIAKAGASKFSVFVFSVTNVLGNNNVFGYNYSNDGKTRQAILPPSKRFFFLGCFLSFGIDRTEDAINNNL
jgi:hypothetical protein